MSRTSQAPRVRPFFNVVSTDEARSHIGEIEALSSESVATRLAADRVLAREVVAAIDMPHFDRANMDGFAVVASDTFRRVRRHSLPILKIAGTVEMGRRGAQAGRPKDRRCVSPRAR